MYEVVFYERDGNSDLLNYLKSLQERSAHNKQARIEYDQIYYCIQLLQMNGTRMGSKYTKYIAQGIWELRPGNNRIFYFYYQENTFVLLHQFRKKTQKTPQREIEKAYRERDHYLRQRGDLK